MELKKLMEKIIKILAQYPTLKDVPAGEWNRIESIIKQAKSEWEKKEAISFGKYLANAVNTETWDAKIVEEEVPKIFNDYLHFCNKPNE
jgi:hypothetical protein